MIVGGRIGNDVGADDGVSLDDVLGVVDGLEFGNSDKRSDGDKVGEESDGLALDTRLGSWEGRALGDSVEIVLAKALGDELDDSDGFVVGSTVDGADEGVIVGF